MIYIFTSFSKDMKCVILFEKGEIIMYTLKDAIKEYLCFCSSQRRLDEKTIKAYRNDLKQFSEFCNYREVLVPKESIKDYITKLHEQYKQKTVKRKIASIKAFYNYLENEERIESSPMRKIRTEFREEFVFPKTIPYQVIEDLLHYMYFLKSRNNLNGWKRKILIRDITVIEMLFATGMRISELCNLSAQRIDFAQGVLCIKGKGAKERYLQIGNPEVLGQIKEYRNLWEIEPEEDSYFFRNRYGNRFSEQSARKMISKYVGQASINMHITPHMFRHAFATLLLEEEVDIRYIQKMLGHSSIVTTQIYTEVACKKQMEILRTKHPRNKMDVLQGRW